jgi:hypothetical protein
MVVKLYLSVSTTVEMCKESVDIECHIFACTSLGACEWWVLCTSLMDRSHIHWIGGWVNVKEVLVVKEKSLTPAWKQILFVMHINSYFGGYGRWWNSVMDIKDKTHLMQSSDQWKLTFKLSVIERQGSEWAWELATITSQDLQRWTICYWLTFVIWEWEF